MIINPPGSSNTPEASPKKLDGAFKPSEYHQQETAKAKSERDEDLAVEIMKLAVEYHKLAPARDDTVLVNTCERLWRWATSDQFKLPEDA